MRKSFKGKVFMIGFGCLSISFGNEVNNDELRFYKCEVRVVGISNIAIISRQEIFDGEGKPINNISRGMAELFLTANEIIVGKNISSQIAGVLKAPEDWKNEPKGLSNGSIVGLVEKADDMLVSLKNECWLIRITPGRVSMIEAEVILERDNVKIATARWGSKPKVLDNQKTVNAFLGIIKMAALNPRANQ